MTRRAWALFAAMCVIWGIPYLLIRVAVRDVAPGTLVFLRTSVGGLILVPLVLRRGGFGPVLRRWRPLLAFSLIEMAIPWLLLSHAEQHLTSSLSGLLVAAVPLVGVLVARLSGADERATLVQLVGLALGIAGVAMLVGLDFSGLHVASLLEIAVVVVGYATAPVILSRRLADLPSIPVVSASLLVVALGYLPYAAVRMPHNLTGTQLGSIVTLALVCTALAFVLFFGLIEAIGPARATVITYVNPAVAVLFGVVFLNEQFTLGMGVGFPLILAGSVLAARRTGVPDAAVPEGAACEPLEDQSTRTTPFAVSNVAATRPVSSSEGSIQSTSTPSNG
jgi:drug/metabolite transporter (DMT)-like permease